MTSPSEGPPTEEESGVVAKKRRWRRTIRGAVAAMEPEERRAEESRLRGVISQLPGWSEARIVLLFVSAFSDEVDTAPFLSMAYDAGRTVILPRVDRATRRLGLHVVRDPLGDLEPGILGIPEPASRLPEAAVESIDWALIPGVAFDERGYRLGRGAGHYDRLLPRMRPDCRCWAVCLSCQLVPTLPVEPHDVALDGVATADRIIRGVGRTPRS